MPPETQQIEQTATNGVASRDDLIAAVREAGGTESVDVASEEAAAADKAGEQATAPATEAAPSQESKLEAILKQREEARSKRVSADEYVAQLRKQAEEERSRIVEEAKAEARRIAAEELETERRKFRESPGAALRAIAGDDPQAVVDAVLKEGTPEARALAKVQAEAAAAREEAKAGRSAKDELEKFKADLAEEKRQAMVARVRTEFLTEHAPAEKAPYLHARFEPEEIFDRAHRLAIEWQKDGLKLGSDFDEATLVAYLEKQSRERVTRALPTTTAPQQVGGVAPAKEPGLAPKVQANGTRTLSAAQGSERRTSPKPLHQMSAADRRAALMAEVAEARRANPESES